MGSTTFDELKEKALSLPLKPGVYLMMDQAGTVIYVGKAKALKNRVSQYFHDPSNHNEKTRAMVAQIDHFDTIVAGSEFEALVLENSLIKRHKPHYNILLKDDKGYPYIRLSVKELYPRFSIQGKLADDGAKYFGPFGGRHDTQAILDAIRGALKLPTCGKKFPRDQGKERPCLNFHMGLCDGYCRKEMPRSQHQEAMAQAIRLLEGKFGQVEKDLREQMEEAAEALEFERAAALRDRLKAITLLGKRQKVVAGFLADTDVLGLYTGQVRSGVAVLHFQGGELAGRDLEVFPTGGEPAEEILSAFLTQFYGARGLLPKQILLPENLEEAPHISRLLSHQAGRKVELVTPQRGAKADLIRMAQENARTECERMTTRAERTASVLRLLAEKLGLPEPPGRIEAYDISNTGASDIVAAMTVFADGKPKKSAYRYFLLRDLDGPDDYASMDQVISRRFKRGPDPRGRGPAGDGAVRPGHSDIRHGEGRPAPDPRPGHAGGAGDRHPGSPGPICFHRADPGGDPPLRRGVPSQTTHENGPRLRPGKNSGHRAGPQKTTTQIVRQREGHSGRQPARPDGGRAQRRGPGGLAAFSRRAGKNQRGGLTNARHHRHGPRPSAVRAGGNGHPPHHRPGEGGHLFQHPV